jgi:hypothetical protein
MLSKVPTRPLQIWVSYRKMAGPFSLAKNFTSKVFQWRGNYHRSVDVNRRKKKGRKLTLTQSKVVLCCMRDDERRPERARKPRMCEKRPEESPAQFGCVS